MQTVLFVCIENSCRSQMAEAFGKMLGADVVECHSSGSRPSGVVNARAIATMRELGYDLSSHRSKSLEQIPQIEWDYVITMGCGDECPYVRTRHREDWQIPDPKHMQPGEFSEVRDAIRDRVAQLIENCRKAIA